MTEVVTKQRPTDQSQISAAGLFQKMRKRSSVNLFDFTTNQSLDRSSNIFNHECLLLIGFNSLNSLDWTNWDWYVVNVGCVMVQTVILSQRFSSSDNALRKGSSTKQINKGRTVVLI